MSSKEPAFGQDEESRIESNETKVVNPSQEKVRVNPLDDWVRPTGLKFYLIYLGWVDFSFTSINSMDI